MMQIAKHKVVSIDYTLTNNAGEVVDSSEGREPLAYLHGSGNIIPGLEQALEGKTQGEKLDVSVAPEHGYGEYIEGLSQTVPREAFGDAPELAVGMQFQAQGEDQRMVVFTIVKIDGDQITIDANHPLAGETLNFKVEVTDIRDATEEEIAHGHVHGAGGHAH